MRRVLHLTLLAATVVVAATLVASARADQPRGRALAEPGGVGMGAAMIVPTEPLHAFLLDEWESSRAIPLRLNALLGNAPVFGPLSLSVLGSPVPVATPSATLLVYRGALEPEASGQLVAAALRTARSAADRALAEALDSSGHWALHTPIDELRGQLPPPVSGRIEIPFGPVRVAGLYTTVRHPGQTWRAEMGAEVAAVARGIVRHAGELNGYGLVVIMDHGAGYYSVYAHLSWVDVEVGGLLEQGVVIGQAGVTGATESAARGEAGMPGLYFELRRYDEALDPTEWLRPIR